MVEFTCKLPAQRLGSLLNLAVGDTRRSLRVESGVLLAPADWMAVRVISEVTAGLAAIQNVRGLDRGSLVERTAVAFVFGFIAGLIHGFGFCFGCCLILISALLKRNLKKVYM